MSPSPTLCHPPDAFSPPEESLLLVQTLSNATEGFGKSAAPKVDIFYLDQYCHIIGPWFDLFDQERHFSLIVPHLALEQDLLKLASLACASRQHHLISASSVDTTLTYYDDALQMLTASLRDGLTSSTAAVFASCLFLAHCEIIGASTQDWHLHLAGTYSLIKTHAWHGQSEGLGQACFW
jgi:hypothetical protein